MSRWQEIAVRSRGTPRIANRLLARVREYAIARADGIVDHPTALEALAVWEVDDRGLDKVDRAILTAVVGKFGGGPVGLSTLATAALVFVLSLRLRRREIETMFKIGAARGAVAGIIITEIAVVIAVALGMAVVLTAVTAQVAPDLIRAIVLS